MAAPAQPAAGCHRGSGLSAQPLYPAPRVRRARRSCQPSKLLRCPCWCRRRRCLGMIADGSNFTSMPFGRSVKSPNVLVDDQWRAKLADFNLSTILRNQTSNSDEPTVTNPLWMVSEYMLLLAWAALPLYGSCSSTPVPLPGCRERRPSDRPLLLCRRLPSCWEGCQRVRDRTPIPWALSCGSSSAGSCLSKRRGKPGPPFSRCVAQRRCLPGTALLPRAAGLPRYCPLCTSTQVAVCCARRLPT